VYPRPPTGSQAKLVISSPLTLLGVFTTVLREYFSAAAVHNPALPWEWEADLATTPLFIEVGWNTHLEARAVRPGVWIDCAQNVYNRVVIGDQDQIPENIPCNLEESYGQGETDISIDCTAAERTESTLLGSHVQNFVHSASNIIQAYFGLRDISPVLMNQTAPFQQDITLWSTPVTFRVNYEIRWATLPIHAILNSVHAHIQNVGDAGVYFRDVALRKLV